MFKIAFCGTMDLFRFSGIESLSAIRAFLCWISSSRKYTKIFVDKMNLIVTWTAQKTKIANDVIFPVFVYVMDVKFSFPCSTGGAFFAI